jgi:hypothetical protein
MTYSLLVSYSYWCETSLIAEVIGPKWREIKTAVIRKTLNWSERRRRRHKNARRQNKLSGIFSLFFLVLFVFLAQEIRSLGFINKNDSPLSSKKSTISIAVGPENPQPPLVSRQSATLTFMPFTQCPDEILYNLEKRPAVPFRSRVHPWFTPVLMSIYSYMCSISSILIWSQRYNAMQAIDGELCICIECHSQVNLELA